jgi:hypothetical protein
MSSLRDQPRKEIIDRIHAGDDVATQAIVMMPPQWVGYCRKLVMAGLVDALLSFVEMSNRMPTDNETVEDVLLSKKGRHRRRCGLPLRLDQCVDESGSERAALAPFIPFVL